MGQDNVVLIMSSHIKFNPYGSNSPPLAAYG